MMAFALILFLCALHETFGVPTSRASHKPLCEAGYHLNPTDDLCVPCEEGTFNSVPGRAHKCATCRTSCTDKRDHIAFIATNCSATTDLTCLCKDGYFAPNQYQFCRRFTECPVGSGVIRPGNATHNVVCEPCKPGYISEITSSTEPCRLNTTDITTQESLYPDFADSSEWITGVVCVLIGVVTGAVMTLLTCCIIRKLRRMKAPRSLEKAAKPDSNATTETTLDGVTVSVTEEVEGLLKSSSEREDKKDNIQTGATQQNRIYKPSAGKLAQKKLTGLVSCLKVHRSNHDNQEQTNSKLLKQQASQVKKILRDNQTFLSEHTDLDDGNFIGTLYSNQTVDDNEKEEIERLMKYIGKPQAYDKLRKCVYHKGLAGLNGLIESYEAVHLTEVTKLLREAMKDCNLENS